MNIIYGSDYLTFNLFLPMVWRMKDVLASKYRDGNEYIKAMELKMYTNFEKYWCECNLLMAIAIVLNPRYKRCWYNFVFL